MIPFLNNRIPVKMPNIVISKALICFPAWFDMVMWLYPLDMKLLKKDVEFCDVETKRKFQISKTEHFINLVQLAVDNNVLFQHILADSWFGSKANMNFIHHDLNKHFIFAIKSNRCVALSKKEASCGQFQRVESLEWNDGESHTVYIKDICFQSHY